MFNLFKLKPITIALLLLVVANAIWITRLYFKRRLMAQQKEIEKQQALQSQRDRISIDMHDDLGSGLSSIKMISEMLKRKHQDEETKTDLNQIVDEASELTATMRDLVWSLNPRNDTILGFADHARRFVKQYFERAGIEVHFQIIELDIPPIFHKSNCMRTGRKPQRCHFLFGPCVRCRKTDSCR